LSVLQRELVLHGGDVLHQHRWGSGGNTSSNVVQTFSEALQSNRAALVSLSVPAILIHGLARGGERLQRGTENGDRAERGPFGNDGCAEDSCRTRRNCG
jgi:hypothetical protein